MADSDPSFTDTYAAIFAPRTHKFDTVNFRVPTSPANIRAYFATSNRQLRSQARIAGLLGVLIGVVVAIVGFGVDQLTRGLTLALYRATDALLRLVEDTNPSIFWLALFVFVVIALVYVIVAAVMVVYIAPLGAGSGIPELKSYLNGVRVPGFLAINSLFVKALGVAFSIGSGLICGKQGPMIHAGAIIGAAMSQAASTRFKYRSNISFFRYFRTETWKRDFTAVGAAVGVAVAFGSPVGAWMWVYEEACTYWSWSLGLITLGGCLSGTVVVRILNHLAAGIPQGFGAFSLTMFGKLVTPVDELTFPLKDVPAYALLGVIGGICGALLPKINKHITEFRFSHIQRPVPRLLESALISILTSFIRVIIPYLANDCRVLNDEMQEVLQQAPLQDFSRFVCKDGEYSTWAAVMYNPTDTVVRALLYTKEQIFPAQAVAVAFAYYFLFIIWTYGIAVPAGVFFPGFLLGSVYGRLVGIAVHAIFGARTDVSLTGYAFLGAVSALAGLTRTISVAVIALEATGSGESSFGAVLVALIAKLVSDYLYTHGIYDLHVHLKGIPYLAKFVPDRSLYLKLRVHNVMSTQVIAVRRLSTVSELLRMLSTNDHHAFPVFIKIVPKDKSSSMSKSYSGGTSGMSTLEVEEMTRGEGMSRQSMMEAQLQEQGEIPLGATTANIFTATDTGMQATIFDEGRIKLVKINDKGESELKFSGSRMTPRGAGPRLLFESSSTDVASSSLDTASLIRGDHEVPDFELMGTIDRGTLLAFLMYECEKEERRKRGEEVDDRAGLPVEQVDDAWPNAARLKGDAEKKLIERVKKCGIDGKIIDLKMHIDPNPVVIFDRAYCYDAYHMFRETGARHIVVANTRLGQIVGIMTRKDVLEESLKKVFDEMHGVKVE